MGIKEIARTGTIALAREKNEEVTEMAKIDFGGVIEEVITSDENGHSPSEAFNETAEEL